jgi:hypothetical protein
MSRQDARGSSLAAYVVALVVGATGLTACGSSEPDPNATPGGAGKSKAARVTGPAGMVAAVSASRAPGAIDVRFRLSGKPTVGQPVDIELALTPTVELESLFARFRPSDGLELTKGAETLHYDHPALGTGLSHTVTVVPKSDGIFNVTATVLTDSSTDSIASTYTLPLIAGAGLPELPATPPSGPPSKPAKP